jgi:hypothetical protein
MKILAPLVLAMSLVAPSVFAGDCNCDKGCAEKCSEGKAQDCKCEHCGCAKKDGKCEKCHHAKKADKKI